MMKPFLADQSAGAQGFHEMLAHHDAQVIGQHVQRAGLGRAFGEVGDALAVAPLVDLGYTRYQGTPLKNGDTQWLGMRYAAPPLGDLRFRVAKDPLPNSTIQMASEVRPMGPLY